MTAQMAIDLFDRMNGNTLDVESKLFWLKQLEMQITEEVISKHVLPEDYEDPDWDEFDLDSELIIPDQYSNIYISYLGSKYHMMVSADTKRYNMAVTDFNNTYITYQQYYNRNNVPVRREVDYTRGADTATGPLNQ
ncbi:MAG: hypothetical protein K5840_00115 [Eubacterium sp.]|nr:hypothetical protein [Eubacterium sp.]